MKETDGWVKIKKYTDDGKPVCGNLSAGPKCVHLAWDGDWAVFMCQYQVADKPGPLCPIWHGESKSESNITTCGYGTRSDMACHVCQEEI